MVTASPLTVLEPIANHDGGNIALVAEGMVATDDLTVQADILADGGTGGSSCMPVTLSIRATT